MKRRTFMQTASAAALPTSFAIAQPADARTLRFVPQANLTLLDPIFTTAQPTVNHGWAVYDLLFGVNGKLEARPQMAEGYTLSDDGRTYTDHAARRAEVPQRRAGARAGLRTSPEALGARARPSARPSGSTSTSASRRTTARCRSR